MSMPPYARKAGPLYLSPSNVGMVIGSIVTLGMSALVGSAGEVVFYATPLLLFAGSQLSYLSLDRKEKTGEGD